jgi:hypothetical protein
MSASCSRSFADEHLGVDLFLDVQRRRVDDEIAPVLLVLPAPDKLGIEIGIARVAEQPRLLVLLLHDGLLLGGGDVLPLGFVVLQGLDGFSCGRFLGHDYSSLVVSCAEAAAIIFSNRPATFAAKSASIS